jgi:cation transport regulator ChaC
MGDYVKGWAGDKSGLEISSMNKSVKVFGYGSLINRQSLRRTEPGACNIIPCKVYGYHRIFNLRSTYKYDPESGRPISVLNLQKGEESDFVNGVCFELPGGISDDLLIREEAYELCEVEVSDYSTSEPLGKVFTFISKVDSPYQYLVDSAAQADYLNICLTGCLEYGPEFVSDFKGATQFWGISPDDAEKRIWCT